MQSKTTVLLKSWKKQRKLHHPHFLQPQSQKLPQRSEKSACSKQNAPPWHVLLDLAESNPAQTLWSKREEWRERHRLIIYVKHVSSPNLQDRERHSIYTANILFVFFLNICKDKYLLKIMQTHATLLFFNFHAYALYTN